MAHLTSDSAAACVKTSRNGHCINSSQKYFQLEQYQQEHNRQTQDQKDDRLVYDEAHGP